MKKFLLLSAILLTSTNAYSEIPSSFSKSKELLYKKVENNSGKTFYVGCSWSKKKVDLASCNLSTSFPKKHLKRASRTEAEHIIPASWMYRENGQWRKCYLEAKKIEENPRKYCQKHDVSYRNAHNDLMNLVPAVGQINAIRSNKPFSEKLSGEGKQTFKGDGLVFSSTSRVVTPDKRIRGDISRVAFYMMDKYKIQYSERQLVLFKKWDKEDPLDDIEKARIDRVKKVQGN